MKITMPRLTEKTSLLNGGTGIVPYYTDSADKSELPVTPKKCPAEASWLFKAAALAATGLGIYFFYSFLYKANYNHYCSPERNDVRDFLPKVADTAENFNCNITNIVGNLCEANLNLLNISDIFTIYCSTLPFSHALIFAIKHDMSTFISDSDLKAEGWAIGITVFSSLMILVCLAASYHAMKDYVSSTETTTSPAPRP